MYSISKSNVQSLNQLITPESIWQHKQTHLIIDVRSPSEFALGHIPGAINMPLFDDKERKIVGTMYKQQSPEAAMTKGLDIVGPKMSGFVRQVRRLETKDLIIYCARGGKRSESMSWLLDLVGNNVKVIIGGYKAFRNYVINGFSELDLQLMVLGGKTGMGKSSLLRELSNQGEQIIDLEKLACHKGSAFGRLGEEPQPRPEHFENLLLDELMKLNLKKTIWLENESKSIGSVYIPLDFWKKMKTAPLINIELDNDVRINNLIKDYGQFDKAALQSCFKTIEKKIGGVACKEAIESIEHGDLKTAAQIALVYYDKTYSYNLENTSSPNVHTINLSSSNDKLNAEILLNYVRTSLPGN